MSLSFTAPTGQTHTAQTGTARTDTAQTDTAQKEAAPSSVRGRVEAQIYGAFDEIGCEGFAPGERPGLDAALLDELGLDSIEHVELISLGWERCGLATRVPVASDIRSLGDLIDRACRELEAA